MAYTYLVVCKPTGEWYYGVRYAGNDDLWSTYFTSSKHVKALISKYGKESFHYEIRKTFGDPRAALLWEHRVLKRILGKPNCLNKNSRLGVYSPDVRDKIHETCLVVGADGLNVYQRRGLKVKESSSKINPKTGNKLSIDRFNTYTKPVMETIGEDGLNVYQRRGLSIIGDNNSSKRSDVKSKISSGVKKYHETHDNAFKGKKHSEKSLEIMRQKKLGENNPCHDTIWVNDGNHNLRVPENDIPLGYSKGRLKNYKLKRTTRTCPHCNKEGAGPNMARYHFDNCKVKINNVQFF